MLATKAIGTLGLGSLGTLVPLHFCPGSTGWVPKLLRLARPDSGFRPAIAGFPQEVVVAKLALRKSCMLSRGLGMLACFYRG